MVKVLAVRMGSFITFIILSICHLEYNKIMPYKKKDHEEYKLTAQR